MTRFIRFVSAFALVTVLAAAVPTLVHAADDPVFSGPQAGEKATPFSVVDVAGESAGKERELLAAIRDNGGTATAAEATMVTSLGVKDLGTPGWFVRTDGRFRTAFEFESGYWSSSALMLPDGKLPARFVLDAAAGYEIPRTNVAVSVVAKNLLDDDQLELLGAPAPRRLVFLQLEFHGEGLRY